MRSPKPLAAAAALVVTLALGGVARAQAVQDEGFNAQNFKPALDPFGYASVNGARSLDLFQLHAAAIFGYADDPLQFTSDSTVARGRDVIRSLTTVDLVASVGLIRLWNGGVEVGIDVPIALANNGLQIENRDLGVHDTGLLDIRTDVKVTLLDREDDVIGVAARGFVYWPTGREEDFTSDGEDVSPGLTLILEKKLGPVRLGLEAGWQHIDGEIREVVSGVEVDDKVLIGAAIAFEPFDAALPLGFYAEVHHFFKLEDPYDHEQDSPIEAGAGLRYTGLFFALLGVSAGLNDGIGTPDVRVFGGVGITF